MSLNTEPRMVTGENGWPFWLWPDGTILPVVSGGADDDDDDDDDDSGEGDDDGEGNEPPKGKKGSQAHMNAISASAKREGRRVGRTDILKKLGVKDEAEAEALIKAAKERSDAEASDLEKEKKRADDAESKASKVEAQLRKINRERLIERRLLDSDVPPKRIGKIARLLDLPEDDEDEELDKDIVDAAITDLKKDMPELFKAAGDGGGNGDGDGEGEKKPEVDPRTGLPPVGSKPPAPPKGGQPPKSTEDQAKDLLKQRHPELAKQS